MKRLILLTLLFLVIYLLAACQSGAGDPALTGEGTPEVTTTGREASAGWVDGSPAEADRAYAKGVEGASPSEDGLMLAGEAVYEEAVVEAEAPVSAPAAEGAADEIAPGSRLTAGEVDDNARWDEYLLFLRDFSGPSVIPVDVSERHQIRVTDGDGRPVLGALVEIEANGQPLARLRSHSDGRVYFFPRAYDGGDQAATYEVQVTAGGETVDLAIPAEGSQREWEVVLPAAAGGGDAVRLDILFLLDATGSMDDEIGQLKDNIRAVSTAIDSLPARPDVRLAMTVYRDRGDAFVSRTFDFTPDVAAFEEALAEVQAAGGGDNPEDLNEAISRAIHTPEWRVEDTVSLIFLVADAPPHLDYGQENHYAVEMLQAAERGIKIYPIASSGLDEQGEYIFRQLAQTTGGRFIFLTYGPEGPGTTGEETTFNVDQYTVSALDDLVVQIVEEELAYQTR